MITHRESVGQPLFPLRTPTGTALVTATILASMVGS
jgi:hypothetical protein